MVSLGNPCENFFQPFCRAKLTNKTYVQHTTSCNRTCCSAKLLLNRGLYTRNTTCNNLVIVRTPVGFNDKVFRHHKFCNKTCSSQQTTSCKYTPDTALYFTPEQGDLNQEYHLQRQARPVTRADAQKNPFSMHPKFATTGNTRR